MPRKIEKIDILNTLISKLNLTTKEKNKVTKISRLLMSPHIMEYSPFIKEPWQVLCLIGKEKAVHDIENKRDTLGLNPAHYCLMGGNLGSVESLYSNHPSLFKKKHRLSLLSIAAVSGNSSIIEWLKIHIKWVNSPFNENWDMGIFFSLFASENDMVWLKKHHPHQFKMKHEKFKTNLAFAAGFSGNLSVLQWIHENYPELFNQRSTSGMYISHAIAASGNIEALRWYATIKPEQMTALTKQKENIAHIASKNGHIDMIRWINNPDHQLKELVKQKNLQGENLAHYAVQSDSVPLINWYHKHYPYMLKQEDRFGRRFIHKTAYHGAVRIMKWVKWNYAHDLYRRAGAHKRSIMHYAAWSSRTEMVKMVFKFHPYIIRNGIPYEAPSPLKKDCLGRSIFEYAARSGSKEVLEHLINIYPKELNKHANLISKIITNAIYSNNLTCIQYAFSLLPEGKTYKIPNNIREKVIEHYENLKTLNNPEYQNILRTQFENRLLRALEKSPQIESIKCSRNTLIAHRIKIDKQLDLNRRTPLPTNRVNTAIGEFKILAAGLFNNEHKLSFSKITVYIWFKIFVKMLPDNFPENKAHELFDKILHEIHPQTRDINKKSRIAMVLLPEIKRLEQKSSSLAQDKSNALIALGKIILQSSNLHTKNFKNKVKKWYKDNIITISKRTEKIKSLFNKNKASRSEKIYHEIREILDINMLKPAPEPKPEKLSNKPQ